MGLLRACLVGAFALATASTIGAGCGGAVAPVAGDGGGGSSGSSSSGGGSSSGGAAEGGPVRDAAPTLDAPFTPEAPVGPCQVDGVPCITSTQCCSGSCVNSTCTS